MTGIGNSLSEPNSYSSNHDGELEGLRGQNLQGLIAWVEHNIGRILRDDPRTNRRSSRDGGALLLGRASGRMAPEARCGSHALFRPRVVMPLFMHICVDRQLGFSEHGWRLKSMFD
jgi:hypothetical protein